MGSTSMVDWFVPDSHAGDKEYISKTKLVVGVAICMCIVAALNAARQFSVGHTTNGIMILGAVVLMFISFAVFKAIQSLTFICNAVTALMYALITFLTFSFGGLSSNVGAWFSLVILLGIMLAGYRMGMFWGVLALLTVIFFYVIELNGYQFNAPHIKITGFFIGVFILCLAILGLSAIYEKTTLHSKRQLNEEQQQSEQQTEVLARAIQEVKQVMSGAARSDLSQRLVGEYQHELAELKDSINSALGMLDQTMSDVNDVSSYFIGGSKQLSESTGRLADTAQSQADALNRITQSMSEIETKTRSNSDHAGEARSTTATALGMVQSGKTKMEEMLGAINQINQTGKEVTKIVKVIDEIAFQTNLLALNAAVEAARAGKYGKGFAVVAEEVRNLANRSSEAARNTTELVSNSQSQLESGVQLADEMSSLQTGIVTEVDKVNRLIEEISRSSSEQRTEIEGINSGLAEVRDVVNSNSDLTQKTAELSSDLSTRASELQHTMERFKLSAVSSDRVPATRLRKVLAPRSGKLPQPPVPQRDRKDDEHSRDA